MSEVLELRYCPVCDVEVEGAPEDFMEADECPECGEWVEFEARKKKRKKRSFKRKGAGSSSRAKKGGLTAGTNSASMIETARSQGKPICQLVVGRDQMSAMVMIYQEFQKILKEENLPHAMVVCRKEIDADVELYDEDIQIIGSVDNYDMGNQFIRYFLTLLSAAFGVGACKLQTSYSIFFPGDSRPTTKMFKNKIGVGVMGGSGDSLMKLNQKAISRKLAGAVVKRLTGRSILTTTLRSMAGGALALGAIGVVFPFIGFIAPCLGIPAWLLMQQRNYKPRQWMAIVGTILGGLGGISWLAFFLLAQQ